MIEIQEFPLVEQILVEYQSRGMTTDTGFTRLKQYFNLCGPYETAKRFGVLVNNSAEEFAVQFMTLVNRLQPGTY